MRYAQPAEGPKALTMGGSAPDAVRNAYRARQPMSVRLNPSGQSIPSTIA